MVIKLKPKFTADQIRKMLTAKLLKIDKAVIAELTLVGESLVKNAREKGKYTDQTGNLRNSIGYLIMRDGVVLDENFRRSARVKSTIKRGKNKGKEKISAGSKDGLIIGQRFAHEASSKFPQGYALIAVAGMEYASAVESKGKDVLTASSIQAKSELKKAIKRIKTRIRSTK